jgi:hypothetical protein
MKGIEIMSWVVNTLLFTLSFSWYLCYQMYKDLKKKDKVIRLQERMLEKAEKDNQVHI